ncbi:TPA: hypothetical protein RQJ46_000130 [Vibrio vulnificus]|nr:hypothetical protein [Vibrio vulnificus]HDY7420555.1 hypothetical protein [Vibrio vulnificus]
MNINGNLTAKATKVTTLEVANAAIFKDNVTFNGKASINNAAISTLSSTNATINNVLNVIGRATFQDDLAVAKKLAANTVESSGAIRAKGAFLEDRYLGIAATAKNSDRLAGKGIAEFALVNSENTFRARQTFDNGLIVKGITNLDQLNVTNAALFHENVTFNKGLYIPASQDITIGDIRVKEELNKHTLRLDDYGQQIGVLEDRMGSGNGNNDPVKGVWYELYASTPSMDVSWELAGEPSKYRFDGQIMRLATFQKQIHDKLHFQTPNSPIAQAIKRSTVHTKMQLASVHGK